MSGGPADDAPPPNALEIEDAALDGMTIDGIRVTDLLERWRNG
ncbi:hypothetical protein [uncultured Jannaschia sp.]|nr:hypothetical protein [uncultured Jannaschia sp.]